MPFLRALLALAAQPMMAEAARGAAATAVLTRATRLTSPAPRLIWWRDGLLLSAVAALALLTRRPGTGLPAVMPVHSFGTVGRDPVSLSSSGQRASTQRGRDEHRAATPSSGPTPEVST